MESTAFSDAAWNALPSIGMLWAMLHKIHCILSGCIGPSSMEFLTESNSKTAGEVSKRTHDLFNNLVKKGLLLSKTTWEKGQNL